MKYVRLPNSDIDVSVVAMGCWALAGDMTWGPQDEGVATDAVRTALDVGINFFDTAEMYGEGLSEQRLGKALAGRRDRAVIASKFNPQHMAPDQVAATCHRSLKYLRTDYIDLYQIHWPSRTVPLADTWAAMEKLQSQGKIRALGVCNFGTGDLGDMSAIGQPVTNQLPYSLLVRAIEYEILPECIRQKLGVLCYSPLAISLLTGKYASAGEVPPGRARTRHFSPDRCLETRHGEPGCEQQTFAALDRIRKICDGLGRTMTEVALAWLLHQPGVRSVLAGIRNPDQAQKNAAAAELALSDDVLTALAEATDPVKQALGSNPDVWETQSRSRFR